MNLSLEAIRRVMPGVVGKELLSELWMASWNSARSNHLDDLNISLGCHRGTIRNRNEDRLAVAEVTSLRGDFYTIAIVCDGVGGSEMGDAAANLAVASFVGEIASNKYDIPLSLLVTDAVCKVDDLVRIQLSGRGATTASIIVVSSRGEFAAVNIGDSRIFSWAPEKGDLKQVSIDDTMENELRGLSIRDPSVLNAKGLRGSLSQAIGESGRTSRDLRVVIFDIESFDGGVILASDGAWKGSPEGFESILRYAKSSSDAMRRVLALALWTGGFDNASIICVQDIQVLMDACKSKRKTDDFRRAGARVWFGDTKIVISEVVSRNDGYRTAVSELDSPTKNDPKKPIRKPGGRRKSVSSKEDTGRQMDLAVDDKKIKQERQNENRPKVEISTDDE